MKTVPADEPAAIPGSPDEHRNRTHQTKFISTLDLMEQGSEVKAVEFLQPANDNNIGVVSVLVLDVVYKLRVAHCGLCLCRHPPTMREQE